MSGPCLAQYPRDPVAAALNAAGKNRAEIRKVLDHYAQDPQKLAAARFLIANMIGKAYKVVGLADARGRVVAFDCLQYPGLDAAQNALDALQKQHGSLNDKVMACSYDLQTLPADFLIEHIDLAFQAWRTLPWARDVTFETFCAYVLPYRAGKEPAERWRPALMERFADLPQKMQSLSDRDEAARLIQDNMNAAVGFWDLYYLHPTEQGCSEMLRSRKGRCGDLSNLADCALRANGIPCAIDYTPYWATTNNNHAWPVVLDRNGEGHAGIGNRAARVYRKTFANQPGNLPYHKARGEEIPPWLDRPDYVDVTRQYEPASDVTLTLPEAAKRAPHAYLCVFNEEEWHPIAWGAVKDGRVTFDGMGQNIAYLPAIYAHQRVVPAGAPFLLTAQGEVRPLIPATSIPITVTVASASPGPETNPDGYVSYPLNAGKTYEMFYYDGGWKSLGKQTAQGKPLTFAGVPSGGLYWLVEDGLQEHVERIFTLEAGHPVWW